MVEDAIAAIQDSGAVELIENRGGGQQLPQERLIEVCNREMSKCLNSQTLATEINGVGSYAAAETHRGREQGNGAADRKIIEDTVNELLQWLTQINFNTAAQPLFEFYDEAEARKDWVDVFAGAREFLEVPVKFAHERLQIPEPVDGEPLLPKADKPAPIANNFSKYQFAAPVTVDPSPANDYTDQLSGLAADPLRVWVEIIRGKLDKIIAGGGTMADFQQELPASYSDLPADELVKVMELAYTTADLAGRYAVEQGE